MEASELLKADLLEIAGGANVALPPLDRNAHGDQNPTALIPEVPAVQEK
jgi:hypothetical protein